MNVATKVIRTLIWLLPIAGAAAGTIVLITGFATATGAPQEAVVAALACALTIIPYCVTRAVAEMFQVWGISPNRQPGTPPESPRSHTTEIRQQPHSENPQPQPLTQSSVPKTPSFTIVDDVSDSANVWKVATAVLAFGTALAITAMYLMSRGWQL